MRRTLARCGVLGARTAPLLSKSKRKKRVVARPTVSPHCTGPTSTSRSNLSPSGVTEVSHPVTQPVKTKAESFSSSTNALPLSSPRKARIREMESHLLRYFGSSAAYAALPQASTTLSLQLQSATDADTMVREMLFPLHTQAVASSSSTTAATTSSSAHTPRHSRFGAKPASFPMNSTSTGSTKGTSPDGAALQQKSISGTTSQQSAIARADYDAARRLIASQSLSPSGKSTEWSDFSLRMLHSRFTNVCDSEQKHYWHVETPYESVQHSVGRVWEQACSAWIDLNEYASQLQNTHEPGVSAAAAAASPSPPPPLPDTVVFLVLFSLTAGALPVGGVMQSLQQRITSELHRPHCYPSVLRCVPILVGVKQPAVGTVFFDVPHHATHAQEDNGCSSGNGSVSEQALSFPNGGLYTLNAVLQYLKRLPTPRIAAVPPITEERTLRRRVLLLSEAWLLPRTVAALHTAVEPKVAHTVEVIPGVVGSELSVREIEALARYTVQRALH